MYSYHNRIKQRINNNELDRFEYIEEHKGDTNYGMMLHFNTEPYTRPIKNHKVKDYEQIFNRLRALTIKKY
jgi:hypothetical protein